MSFFGFFHSRREQEMRELQRKLDHDLKLKDFFAIKSNVRVNAELEERESDRKQLQQELADKQLTDLQNIMKEMQVRRRKPPKFHLINECGASCVTTKLFHLLFTQMFK